ncbi:MAG: glycoside hydrolase family 11 protein [Fibromonadaceae bacterium]|nr:glycoside hydrolase family 11 protein [Fibromonadaceae bacterium]
MKKLTIALSLAITFAAPVFGQVNPCDQTTQLSATASDARTFTSNSNGNQNLGGSADLNFGYEMWTEGGNSNKLIWYGPNQGGGYAFRAEWNNPTDFLGRLGYFWGKTGKKWDQFKNICADFNYKRSDNGTGGGYSYIGIYGWTWNGMMEWYIIDDWFTAGKLGPNTLCGGSCQPIGTVEADGGVYDIYTNTRPSGSGSIDDSKPAFPQIFSIRQGMDTKRRQCGTYSIKKHFDAWSKISSIKDKIGNNTYEAKFLVEAGGGTGWFDLSYLKMYQTDGECGIVVPAGSYTLELTASPSNGGSIAKTPSNPYYSSGSSVSLKANPASGWKFDSWSGDATGTANPVSVTMNANKSVIAKFTPLIDPTANIIKNGNFANTSDWEFNKGSGYGNSDGSFNVASNKATINITKIGDSGENVWEPQLVQNGVTLVEGMNYRLTFDASAGAARKIGVIIQMAGDPWTTYFEKTDVSLTTATQTFTYDFKMEKASDENGRIGFNFGQPNGTGTVTFSNIKLNYIAETPTSSSSGEDLSSSSSDEDTEPILKNRIPLTNFSIQPLRDKSLRIEVSSPSVVEIFNLKGNKVTSLNVSGSQTVKLSLPNGVYFAKAHGTKSIRFVLK